MLLDPVDRGRGRAARGQHGVDDQDQPAVHARRQMLVIVDRLQGGRVAIEADMADPRLRHQRPQPFQQPLARAQHRDEEQGVLLQPSRLHLLQRGRDRAAHQRQIAGGLGPRISDRPRIADRKAGIAVSRSRSVVR